MKVKNTFAVEMRKIGLKKLSPQRRSEIAKNAAKSRWKRKNDTTTNERLDYYPAEKKDRYQGIFIEKHTEVYIKRVKTKK